MDLALARTLVFVIQAYALCGVLFATVFVLRGLGAVDPAAREGSWGLRCLLFPGCALMWPYLAWRWARHPQRPAASETHRRFEASS